MLAMSDTPIEKFLPFFASSGIDVCFLVLTPTGYEKSIMDATAPVRDMLSSKGIHDYSLQGQGQENKVVIKSYFVEVDGVKETAASLYRPVTKNGDPRIWFHNLRKYCKPCNLLALVFIEKEIYVINLSNPLISNSLLGKGYVYDIVREAVIKDEQIANELSNFMRSIL